MSEPTHVDGNALGGLLLELFDQDMTGRPGRCGECGSVKPLAEVHVFRAAPGEVLRCSVCGKVLMVIVSLPTGYRVSFEALSWVEVER